MFLSPFLIPAMDNRIDTTFDKAQQAAALKALADLTAALPALHDLSPDDRRHLFKLGDKSRAFVDQALVAAQQFTDALPRSFDVEQYARDVELYRALEPIHARLRDLFERVDDTRMLVGSEAMEGSRAVYYHTKGHPGTGPARSPRHRGRWAGATTAARRRLPASGRRASHSRRTSATTSGPGRGRPWGSPADRRGSRETRRVSPDPPRVSRVDRRGRSERRRVWPETRQRSSLTPPESRAALGESGGTPPECAETLAESRETDRESRVTPEVSWNVSAGVGPDSAGVSARAFWRSREGRGHVQGVRRHVAAGWGVAGVSLRVTPSHQSATAAESYAERGTASYSRTVARTMFADRSSPGPSPRNARSASTEAHSS